MKKKITIIISVVILALCVSILLFLFIGSNGPQSTSDDDTTEYAVTFYSNDGTVIKIDSVKENSSAIPPITPKMEYGTIFKSWDTDFSNVTQDLCIYPLCEEIKGKPNVIAAQSAYSKKDNTVVVPIQLCGDVCVAGLDITILYDSELLKLESITEDKAVVFNDKKDGIIKLNYISVENTIGDVDICNLKFIVNATEGEIPITIEVNEIYALEDEGEANDLYIPESTVINGKVFVVK